MVNNNLASEVASALVAAVLGGIVCWIAVFEGLLLGGYIMGLAVTVGLLAGLGGRSGGQRSFLVMAAFGFAFILLTWPALWLVVGLIWSGITGQSFGD